jgi:predicted nuclease of predicted toxin-antitoxin system
LKLEDFPLLTDENIHAEVVVFLRDQGFSVLDVREEGLHGSTDSEVLQRAVSDNRVVFTHDSDFGSLVIMAGEPVIGVVYLRPGHIDPSFTNESIEAIIKEGLDLTPPFLLVAQRKRNNVAIRLRSL